MSLAEDHGGVHVYIPVMNLGNVPHYATDEVLNKKVSMLGMLHSQLIPFNLLSDAVFIESKNVYLSLNDAAKQTSSQEFQVD